MRILLFGTSAFAVPSLERLVAQRHDVVRCVTQPDRPQGRGLQPQPSPVKAAAGRLGVPVDEPADLRAAGAAYQALAPDAGVVIAYGRLIPAALLGLPRHGMLGVHPSLLPRYRGASPMVWALLNGEAATGVSIFRLNERMDAGDVLLQREAPIAAGETTGSLSDRLAALGAELLVEALRAMEQGTARWQPQDERLATTTEKLTKAHGRIRWAEDAAVIDRKVRALNPWPGAFASWQGRPLKLWSVSTGSPVEAPPGQVTAVAADGITVAASRGTVCLHELQLPGGRRMTAREFLAGHPLRVGDRLGDDG